MQKEEKVDAARGFLVDEGDRKRVEKRQVAKECGRVGRGML